MKVSDVNRPLSIVAALVVAACGALFYNMLPLYLGLTQESRQLDTTATGLVSGAFFLGYNLSTISAFFWIRRVDWLLVTLICAPLAAGMLYAGVVVPGYGLLVAVTVLAGAAFAALYGIGTTAIGDVRNASRWYGVKIACEAGLGAVLFFILPSTLVATRGLEGLVMGMVLAMVLLAPLMFFLPRHGSKLVTGNQSELADKPDHTATNRARWAVWLALAATLLFFAGQTTIWAFIERLGAAGGFPVETVGYLLSITLLFAVAGSLTCAVLGIRYGNVAPFVAACLVSAVAIICLSQAAQFSFYALGACSVTYAFGMGLPFIVARVAELDFDGRHIVLTVPAVGIGAMIGPSLAGILSRGSNLLPVLSFSGAVMAMALVLAVLTRR